MSPLAAELKMSLQIPVSVKSHLWGFSGGFFVPLFVCLFERREENIDQIAAWTLTDPGCTEDG